MMNEALPILYSFRRCPYAMRARLALSVSDTRCELREIVLRDKAPEFVQASPKATVPVVALPDGTVIDESFDVMLWALERHDPDEWLKPERGTRDDMLALISLNDGEFKRNLDRYKYPNRHGGEDPAVAREAGASFLRLLDAKLANTAFLTGSRISLADMAIAPFVRQFANVDRNWFDNQDWQHLRDWLEQFLASERFASIMDKHPKWQAGDPLTLFP